MKLFFCRAAAGRWRLGLILLVWLCGSRLAYGKQFYLDPEPDEGRFVVRNLPGNERTYRSEAEYVHIAQDALKKKYGKDLPVYRLDVPIVSLRVYKGLPEKDRNMILVCMTQESVLRENLARDRYNLKTENHKVIAVLIRKDLKKIYISIRRFKVM